jgi:predicted MFS family arabinose efflux permease
LTTAGALYNRHFVFLNVILFLAAATMAIFFQFHQHLRVLGVEPKWFGFLIGADSLASLVVQPVLAPFIHSGNSRRYMAIGLCGLVISLLLYGRAVTLFPLIMVRMLHGAAFITLISGMMVSMVDHIPREKSGQAFGFVSITRLLPYALVPPLVGAAMARMDGFAEVLLMGAGLMVLALLILILALPQQGDRTSQGSPQRIPTKELFDDLATREVSLLLLINLLLYSGYSVTFFFLKDFGIKAGINNPGFFFTVATMVMLVARVAGGALFDRLSKPWLTAGAMAALVLAYLLLPQVRSSGELSLLALLFGMAWGVVMPLLNAIMFDFSPPRYRGVNLNLSLVMMQAAFFVGPLAGGMILNAFGYSILFFCCAVLSLVAALLAGALSRTHSGDIVRNR